MLSPTQQNAYNNILQLLSTYKIIGFDCPYGNGRTTILQKLAKERQGHYIRMADFFDQIKKLDPLQIEESIVQTITLALDKHDLIIVDDFSRVIFPLQDCIDRARPDYLEVALDSICRYIELSDKQIIFGLSNSLPSPLSDYSAEVEMPPFNVDDFAFLFKTFSRRPLTGIDFNEVHRFAPRLSAYRMYNACQALEATDLNNTATFLKFLEEHALVSNVNTREVEEVDFNSLYGVKDVIRQLEINIINPLERSDLIEKYGLKAKRGVLLYGPPGTGKTSIGRALAHRLNSKFFLIDGTVISGTSNFYYYIQQTFKKAKENAPSVLFIDDCDLLFENEEEPGLYRYLLTMLDGLESKSNAQITLMLTAMNIGSLPPALIRSGRVELWLKMKLPDLDARRAIIQGQLLDFPLEIVEEDLHTIAKKSEGFTGADLKRLVVDAKNLLGYAIAEGQAPKSMYSYLEEAIVLLHQHRKQFEDAPAYTAAHQPKKKHVQ